MSETYPRWTVCRLTWLQQIRAVSNDQELYGLLQRWQTLEIKGAGCVLLLALADYHQAMGTVDWELWRVLRRFVRFATSVVRCRRPPFPGIVADPIGGHMYPGMLIAKHFHEELLSIEKALDGLDESAIKEGLGRIGPDFEDVLWHRGDMSILARHAGFIAK